MISVIGEGLVDLVDQGSGAIEDSRDVSRPFLGFPGGSPLNVAVGVSRLGRPASFLGRIGRDAFGRLIRSHAVANDVGLSTAVDAVEPSTLAIVSVDAEHKAIYDFYVNGTADWQWTPAELDTLPAGTTMVHTGSIASWTPPGDVAIAARLERARHEGMLTSYDPNVRPALMPPDGVARVEQLVTQAGLVKASDDDLAYLYPGVDVDTVGRRWASLGPALVVVTRGADGADAFGATGTVHCDGIRVDVVDTVGAGDAFMAGLLAGLDARDVRAGDDIAAFAADQDAVHRLLGEAMVIAAITCSRAGANPPTAAEVARYGTAATATDDPDGDPTTGAAGDAAGASSRGPA